MLTIRSFDEAKAREGDEIGVSDWHLVTQESVDRFADVTGDQYFIHTDPERAKETPFGGTIAHGYYTLSLAPKFAYSLVSYEGFAFGVNYGCNRVRFPAPMPVGWARPHAHGPGQDRGDPRRRPDHQRADVRARGR